MSAPGTGGRQESERLPLFLDLTGRKVVVVGAGKVAARKIDDLLRAAADVVVVAPAAAAAAEVVDWARAGVISWHPSAFAAGDLDDAWLAIAATDDSAVNAAVVLAAEVRRIFAINAGQASSSPAWGAIKVDAGDGVVVAVSGGRDPGRAKSVAAAVGEAATAGRLPARRQRPRRPGGGIVHLVGGGPGDPDLLTVRARRLLATADVVVTDRLAPQVAELDCEVIDVGKAPGRHAMAQEAINDLLVQRGLAGQVVVRLKGGDPFVLGRGGEEALACAAAGLPVTVVPGATSAVSVPAAAGIPVTHRGLAASFAVISAHNAAAALEQASRVTPGTTLVLLMGVATLADITAGLRTSGWDPATPAAIIERGWQPGQRTTFATLDDVAASAARIGVSSPAVVVIGDVVAVGQALSAGVPQELEVPA